MKLGEDMGDGWVLASIDEGGVDDLGNGIVRNRPANYTAERYEDQIRLTVSGSSKKELMARIAARQRYLAKKGSVYGEEGSSGGEANLAVSRVVVPANENEPTGEVEE